MVIQDLNNCEFCLGLAQSIAMQSVMPLYVSGIKSMLDGHLSGCFIVILVCCVTATLLLKRKRFCDFISHVVADVYYLTTSAPISSDNCLFHLEPQASEFSIDTGFSRSKPPLKPCQGNLNSVLLGRMFFMIDDESSMKAYCRQVIHDVKNDLPKAIQDESFLSPLYALGCTILLKEAERLTPGRLMGRWRSHAARYLRKYWTTDDFDREEGGLFDVGHGSNWYQIPTRYCIELRVVRLGNCVLPEWLINNLATPPPEYCHNDPLLLPIPIRRDSPHHFGHAYSSDNSGDGPIIRAISYLFSYLYWKHCCNFWVAIIFSPIPLVAAFPVFFKLVYLGNRDYGRNSISNSMMLIFSLFEWFVCPLITATFPAWTNIFIVYFYLLLIIYIIHCKGLIYEVGPSIVTISNYNIRLHWAITSIWMAGYEKFSGLTNLAIAGFFFLWLCLSFSMQGPYMAVMMPGHPSNWKTWGVSVIINSFISYTVGSVLVFIAKIVLRFIAFGVEFSSDNSGDGPWDVYLFLACLLFIPFLCFLVCCIYFLFTTFLPFLFFIYESLQIRRCFQCDPEEEFSMYITDLESGNTTHVFSDDLLKCVYCDPHFEPQAGENFLLEIRALVEAFDDQLSMHFPYVSKTDIIKKVEVIAMYCIQVSRSRDYVDILNSSVSLIHGMFDGPITLFLIAEAQKMFQSAAVDEQAFPAISKCREIVKNWRNMIDSSLGNKLHEFFALCSYVGVLTSLGLPVKSSTFMELYKVNKMHQQWSASIYLQIVDSVLFVCERLADFVETRDYKTLLFSDDEARRDDAEFCYLKGNYGRYKAGAIENETITNEDGSVRPVVTDLEFRDRVFMLLEKFRLKNLTYHEKKINTPERTIFLSKLAEVEKMNSEIIVTINMNLCREAPFNVVLNGLTGQGKSSIVKVLAKLFCHNLGLPYHDNLIVNINGKDAFQSEVKTRHIGIIVDDFANATQATSQVNPTSVVIDMCNNIRKNVLKAEVSEKGLVQWNNIFTIVTTNVPHLDSNAYSNEPASFMRRFPYHITMRIRPEFSLARPGEVAEIDPTRMEGAIIMDAWTFTVNRVQLVERTSSPQQSTSTHNPTAWYFKPAMGVTIDGGNIKELNNIGLWELTYFLTQQMTRHRANQRAFVDRLSELNEAPWCEHSRIQQVCDICNPVEPQAGDVRGLFSRFVRLFNFNFPRTYFTLPVLYSLVNSAWARMSLEAMQHFCGGWYVHACIWTATSGVYLSTCVYYILPTRLRKYVTLEPYVNLAKNTWFKYGNFWAVRAIVLSVGATSGIFTYWSLFYLDCVLGTGFLSAVWFTSSVSTYITYAVQNRVWGAIATAISNIPLQDGRRIANNIYKSKYRILLLAIPGFYILKVIFSQYFSEEKCEGVSVQGGFHSSVPEPGPSYREKDVWQVQVDRMVTLPAGSKAKNARPEDFESIISKSQVYVESYKDPSFKRHCNGIFVCTNFLLVPYHLLLTRCGFAEFIEVFFTDKEKKGSHYKVRIDPMCFRKIEGRDLVLIYTASGGSRLDLLKFSAFSDDIVKTRNMEVTELYRNSKGLIEKDRYAGTSDVIRDIERDEPELRSVYPGYIYDRNSPTFVGLCGASLISKVNGGSTIIGFHILGATGLKHGRGLSITRKMIEDARDYMLENNILVHQAADVGQICPYLPHVWTDKNELIIYDDIHPKSVVNSLPPESSVRCYGAHNQPRRSVRSQVLPLKIAQSVERICGQPITHGPPKNIGKLQVWYDNLLPTTGFYQLKWKPLLLSFTDIRDQIGAAITTNISKFKGVSPYSVEVALNGYPGVRGVNPIKLTSSMGWPICSAKKNFLGRDEPTEVFTSGPIVLDDDMKADIECLRDICASGKRPCTVFRACQKDEPTKLDKEKVRIFAAGNLYLSILIRQYFLPISKIMKDYPFLFSTAVGINCYGIEWEKVFTASTVFGEDRTFDGDYAEYDKRMEYQILILAFKLFIYIASFLNYTKTDLIIMNSLAEDVCRAIWEFNGEFIENERVNSSGHDLTVEINGLVNWILVGYAFYSRASLQVIRDSEEWIGNWSERLSDLMPDIDLSFMNQLDLMPLIPTLKGRMAHYLMVMTLGDDNMVNVSRSIDWFDHIAMFEELRDIGLNYTTANKEVPTEAFNHIEVQFLKRGFVFNAALNRIVGPLVMSSIWKKLFCRKGKELVEEVHCAEQINEALREFFLHGEIEFRLRREQLIRVAEENNLMNWFEGGEPFTYEYLLEWFSSMSAEGTDEATPD